MYLENNSGALSGTTLTFTAEVLSNTFASSHLALAFIKDFAPDYSSFNVVTAPLVNGTFSISLDTINQPGRHVQYGFTVTRPDVWITDTAPIGKAQIAPVPEPASVGVLAGGLIGLLCTRQLRNRRLCPK